MKHTPGPWIHDTRGYPHPDVKAASGRNIACTWGVNNQPKTPEAAAAQQEIARANARLIAAAPELLEALKEVLNNPAGDYDASDGYENAVKQARAAIAKATGAQS
jgi:hypothetical protein